MKLSTLLLAAIAFAPTHVLSAVADTTALIPRHGHDSIPAPNVPDEDPRRPLWKRKGGGGGRGGGRGGGGRSSSKPGSSSKSAPSRTSSSSNAGGRTSSGSGPPPLYGNGRYYSGGSTVPYTAGARSPSLITPILAGAAVGLTFASLVALASYPFYLYPWPQPYTFFNATANANQTDNVICGCRMYGVCGCDYTNDTAYLESIIGNGSVAAMNSSLVAVALYEGSQTILIDGSLPNGTTAAGGSDDAGMSLVPLAGYWSIALLVGCMAWML